MDTQELGGNIHLSGFSELDRGQMIVLKKIIGNYARKFSERSEKFEQLSLSMKPIHQNSANRGYELHAKLMDNGKPYAGEATEQNVFVAVDSALKKIESDLI